MVVASRFLKFPIQNRLAKLKNPGESPDQRARLCTDPRGYTRGQKAEEREQRKATRIFHNN